MLMSEQESQTIAQNAFHKQMQINQDINVLTAQIDLLLNNGTDLDSAIFKQLSDAIAILEHESRNWYAVMMEMTP